MHTSLINLVRSRAKNRCEYCCLPEELSSIPFEIDHIIAQKHRGATVEDNLALSCFSCNSFKGSNIAGLDPQTNELTSLFHPRRDHWFDHFEWRGATLVGRTPVGRTTIEVLGINYPDCVALRKSLREEGRFTDNPGG